MDVKAPGPRGSYKRRKLHRWWITTLLLYQLASSKGDTFVGHCPQECRCDMIAHRDQEPSVRVFCDQGNMHAIPVEYLDQRAEILIIAPPPEHPNFLTIGPIFTQPVPFTNLTEIHIVNSNVPSIGKHSFWGLKNLRLLNMTNNNLTSLNTENFKGLNFNLTELHLDHNKISQMPSETFGHLTSLNTLSLSHNLVSQLVPRLFRMLAKLTYLDLSYNPLHEGLDAEVFKDVQHLKTFKCRGCQISWVNAQIYHIIPLLEELDLGDNMFNYITPDQFVNLKNLKVLKLDGNRIPVLVDNVFGHLKQLRFLTMSRNLLALLDPFAFTNLTSLTSLDISHNKIKTFNIKTFAPVVDSLRKINFSGNNMALSEISIVLQILPQINSVGLGNLSIEEISPHFFAHNQHLDDLDLSWNKFKRFPFKLLTKTRYLQKLDISYNRMESLDEMALERLEAISVVNIANNRWRCDQCSAGTMIMFMSTSVLNETIRPVKCHSPYKLRGVRFGELSFDRLETCPSAQEAQLSVIAGLMLLCVAVLGAVATALCCTRRRAAHYYTHEEKRRDHDHPEELLAQTELGSVATIHAPYQLVSKDS